MSSPLPPIPSSFITRKTSILASLSAPSPTYHDLSPKGSVDAAIKDLINRINTLEGIITTSSCAGRVSVFLEGKKKRFQAQDDGQDDRAGSLGAEAQAAVPGGKGMGGRWLFVSHEPIDIPKISCYVSRMLGLEPMNGVQCEVVAMEPSELRLARFQFEPMILHIMTASLHHAQRVLTAAINAGFRESGVQSLKNLDDPQAFPMVAIRSSGLAFESVVGASTFEAEERYNDDEDVNSLVTEEYLELLLKLANERFKANSERMKRFEDELFGKQIRKETPWEDGETRRERKRAEGLRKQNSLREQAVTHVGNETVQLDAGGDSSQENDIQLGSLSLQ